jgi:putative holliday junction resolvase
MNRYLALDYGEKRIGVAISDPLNMTAQPKPFISNDPELKKILSTMLEEFEITTIILGLPTNRFGEDTQKTKEVRVFKETLESWIDLPIIFRDERYSTKAVERHLISADVSRKKRKQVVDGQSAAFVLQGFLDSC